MLSFKHRANKEICKNEIYFEIHKQRVDLAVTPAGLFLQACHFSFKTGHMPSYSYLLGICHPGVEDTWPF
jgi:hypothetical protein